MSTFLLALMLFQAKVIECNQHAPWKAADRVALLQVDDDDGDECFTIETDMDKWEI